VTGELLYSGSISVSYEGGLHWSNNDRFVCLASSDPNAFILLLEVETGQMDSVFSHSELDGLLKDSYLSQIEYVDDIRQQVVLRVESKAEGTYLVRFDFWSDGSGSPQTIPDYYSQNGDTQWQYLDGQTGLALVDNTLMQADLTEGATAVKVASNVSAFALSKDRKYIAYIQGDAYTTSDLYIARYLNGSLINTRMVYKGLSSDGTLMSFSPDNHQLILNVQRRSSASTSRQTMVLEFQ
ncbi:MAG: hypothetical protein PHD32_08740, partial [Eubacteriales bacterium]|nr:hypothetical protein [Eubacteriales bacterium]